MGQHEYEQETWSTRKGIHKEMIVLDWGLTTFLLRFEPYHIRAVAEELAVEKGGKKPAGSEKHMMWGEVDFF